MKRRWQVLLRNTEVPFESVTWYPVRQFWTRWAADRYATVTRSRLLRTFSEIWETRTERITAQADGESRLQRR